MLLRELAEVKISAAHLRKILDTIPTLASGNLPDGSNEFLNQRWHDYTGLSPQEARGWGWRVAIHPDDLQKVLDTFRALRTSGEPREIEHTQSGERPGLRPRLRAARRSADAQSSSAPGIRRSRLIARAVASAASSAGATHVTCPILRPRRGSALP